MSRKEILPEEGFGEVPKEASTSDNALPLINVDEEEVAEELAETLLATLIAQQAQLDAVSKIENELRQFEAMPAPDIRSKPTKRKKKYSDEKEVNEEVNPKRAKRNARSRIPNNESCVNYRHRKLDNAASASTELNEKFPDATKLCESVWLISIKNMTVKDFPRDERRAYSAAKDRNYISNKAIIYEALLEFVKNDEDGKLTEVQKLRVANLTICLGVMMAEQDNFEYAIRHQVEKDKVHIFYKDPKNRLKFLKAPPCLPSDAEFISGISEMLILEKEQPTFVRNYKFPDIFKEQVLRPMLSAIAKNEQDNLSSVVTSFTNFRALSAENDVAEAKDAPAATINPRGDKASRVAKASSSQSKFS